MKKELLLLLSQEYWEQLRLPQSWGRRLVAQLVGEILTTAPDVDVNGWVKVAECAYGQG